MQISLQYFNPGTTSYVAIAIAIDDYVTTFLYSACLVDLFLLDVPMLNNSSDNIAIFIGGVVGVVTYTAINCHYNIVYCVYEKVS